MIIKKAIYSVFAGLLLCGCGERQSNESDEGGPAGRGPRIGGFSDSRRSDAGGEVSLEEVSVESLLDMDHRDLIGFFKRLNGSDPRKSCEIILKMPLSKQKVFLPAALGALGGRDPLAAFAVMDALQAGALRNSCVSALGQVMGVEAWNELGPLLPDLFPEDRTRLVNAYDATGLEEIKSVIQALETNGIGGEPLAIVKSKLAYAIGSADPDGTGFEATSAMDGREKEAYINGVISRNPGRALTAALKLAEGDPEILSRVAGQLVAGMFENDGPDDTISFVSNLDLEPKDRGLLMRTAFQKWLEDEPESASRFIAGLPPGMDRKTGIRAVVAYSEHVGDEAAAAQWRALLEDE